MRTVTTYAEAVATVGRSHLRRMMRQGVWQRPAADVYVMHNGPLRPGERLEVARLACGRGAVLGGLTALELDGFEGPASPHPVVVMPIGARRPRHDDVTPHWSSKLGLEDVHPGREPRRTRPARSLIDAASWAGSDIAARRIIISGIQQGLSTTRSIREAMTRRGTCRRRALIIESVLDAAGGIQSLPERDFTVIVAQFDLPRPSRQQAVRGADGRYYLDADWTDYAVSAEIHGIPHLDVPRWDDDLRRGNEIVIGGRRVVVFSSFGVRHHASQVGDQLRRLLLSAGWTQESTPRSA